MKNSLNEARLGDIVLIKGMMKIFDAEMVHLCMPIAKKIKANEIKQCKNNNEKNALKNELAGLEDAEEMIKILPLTAHIDLPIHVATLVGCQ